MTCIVGLIDDGDVYIGGDSAGVAGTDITVMANEKVFISRDFIYGFTESFRMGQLLRYAFRPPPRKVSLLPYMVVDFVTELRACFSAHGWERKEEDGADKGGCFLVGHAGRLFLVDSDFQVGESVVPYASIGCGEGFALGSLYASTVKSPRGRVKQSLEAAGYHSVGVSAPFVIKKLKGE